MCINLLKYKNKYLNDKHNFELEINKLLYEELTKKHKSMKFIMLQTEHNYSNQELYLCKINFTDNTETNTNMNIDMNIKLAIFITETKTETETNNQTKLNKIRKNYTTDQVKQLYPNLFLSIKSFYDEIIISLDKYNELNDLWKEIIKTKKYILENYEKNMFATYLYQYYYSNIDKFINLSNNNSDYGWVFGVNKAHLTEYKNFYDNLRKKYNFSEFANFELDYLQHYFENKMLLLPDFTANYEIVDSTTKSTKSTKSTNFSSDIGSCCYNMIFENAKYVLKIYHYNKRYVNSYQPCYNVILVEKTQANIVKKIGYNEFDEDRNLDYFFRNILEFIGETVNEIYN